MADEPTNEEQARYGEAEGDHQPEAPQQPGEDTIEVPPQIVHGISIFLMDNGKPQVEVTGTPSLLDLQMLLAPALANIEGDITATKVVEMMKAEAQVRAAEMQTQAVRRRLGGGR